MTKLNEGRDYTIVIDKSGSMGAADCANGKTRWDAIQESTLALARKCEKYDPDGLTLYLFSGGFKRYDNVRSTMVGNVFDENEPNGGTDLAKVLMDVFVQHFLRPNARPETILVVTDGVPDDQRAVMKTIIEATRKLNRDEELAMSFIQIGKDQGASKFLAALDDDLVKAGAKFDIVDTITFEEMENTSLEEVLLRAIRD